MSFHQSSWQPCLHIFTLQLRLCQLNILSQSQKEKEYIIPCVLENTSAKELDLFHKESCRSCLVEPLLMYFSSGFTPMGLFSASTACLVSNMSYTFIREGVKKNMVHFLYGSNLIRVTFVVRSNYSKLQFHVILHSKTPFIMNVLL